MDKLLENQVLELRKNGETYQNIVNITGLTTYKISEICRRNGLCKELQVLTEEQINNCIELYKCKLLCSNCHQELHHPSLTLDRYEEIKKLGSGIKYKKPHDLECLGR